MTKKIIAVDCDGVVVDSCRMWDKWLQERFQLNAQEFNRWVQSDGTMPSKPYKLGSLYSMPEGITGLEFWKSSDLYDKMRPIEGAYENLLELHTKGFDIIFVSRVVGDHASSKCKFLKKWFPFIEGILLTGKHPREKSFVRCDYVVDDCLSQLLHFPESVTKVHLLTEYVEEGLPPYSYGDKLVGLNNLTEVKDFILFKEGIV